MSACGFPDLDVSPPVFVPNVCKEKRWWHHLCKNVQRSCGKKKDDGNVRPLTPWIQKQTPVLPQSCQLFRDTGFLWLHGHSLPTPLESKDLCQSWRLLPNCLQFFLRVLSYFHIIYKVSSKAYSTFRKRQTSYCRVLSWWFSFIHNSNKNSWVLSVYFLLWIASNSEVAHVQVCTWLVPST